MGSSLAGAASSSRASGRLTVAVTSMSFVGRRMAGADASAARSTAADDARFDLGDARRCGELVALGEALAQRLVLDEEPLEHLDHPAKQRQRDARRRRLEPPLGALRHRILATPSPSDGGWRGRRCPWRASTRARLVQTVGAGDRARRRRSLNVASRGKIWSLWRNARVRICRRAVACAAAARSSSKPSSLVSALGR